MLIDNGIDISGLKISSTSHVTMPYHRLLDEAMESDRGSNKINLQEEVSVQPMQTSLKETVSE